MSVVFRKTDLGYHVVSPFGYLSPISIATKSDKDLSRAKWVYGATYSVCILVAISRFNLSEGGWSSESMELSKLLVTIFVAMYLLIILVMPHGEVFKAKLHGVIVHNEVSPKE